MMQLRNAVFHAALTAQFLLATAAAGKPPRLIAHRGGVVGEEFAENGPASLNAAIERGYWMVEVDIRESKDGKLLVQHDPDFQRFFGNPGKVAEMNCSESALCGHSGGTPLHFQNCRNCARARGLMLAQAA